MLDAEFRQLLLADDVDGLFDEYPLYALNSPGMPLPGPDFIAASQSLGDPEPAYTKGRVSERSITNPGKYLKYLYWRALYDSQFALTVSHKGQQHVVDFVVGHPWGQEASGPVALSEHYPKVMVIGKQPSVNAISWPTGRRNFVGPISEPLYKAVGEAGIPESEASEWYMTNVVRHVSPRASSGALPAAWVKNCEIILQQELRLTRPDYILCLGSEASKCLLGRGYGVEAMKGRVMDYEFPTHELGATPEHHTARVMTAVHPAAVHHTPERYDELLGTIRQFYSLAHGQPIGFAEDDIEHHVVYKERELARLVDEALADPSGDVIAVDAEWHGDYPWEPNSYLRTVQWSHRSKFAVCVVLNHAGGESAFVPSIDAAARQLSRLFARPGVKVGGHFFRSDLPWLRHKLGLDLREQYADGFDTSLMCHALHETTRFKLEEQAVRRTGCPRYDTELEQWKTDYCKQNGITAKDMEGYGECPAEVLHPYANYDADVTRRLYSVFDEELNSDEFGNDCRDAYATSHKASLAFLEMEQSGLLVDMERAEHLIRLFSEAKSREVESLRAELGWAEFNPASSHHCRAVLFGDRHAFKMLPDGTQQLMRPDGVVTLNLQPITSTGARPQSWDDICTRNEEHLHTPSTNRETLGILGQQHPIAAQIRDIRFLDQVLKTTLRHSVVDEQGLPELDDDGDKIYKQGLLSHVSSDGRIHTHLMQILETGRASSARPNLQNISKRREDDYRRIIGERYEYPIRSIFAASPGHLLVEADYTGAELAAIMWLADDPTGIEHVRRNMLPEVHDDHYDIHSQAAVRAFRLDCLPTKSGLKDAGVSGMRVAAKNVNFGIPYGRGAAAIARQCREEGVDIVESEAQLLINNYFETYPGVEGFLSKCRERATDQRWLRNAFGRYRRFYEISPDLRSKVGEAERQAQNFPIQSLVADAMSLALHNLYEYRKHHDVDYRIVLQIHDAVLLEVPYRHMQEVCEVVLPKCMTEDVPVYPNDIDGTLWQEGQPGPYYLSTDVDVCRYWGQTLSPAEVAQFIEEEE